MADFTPQDTNAWHQAVRVDALREMKEVNAAGEPMPIVTAIKGLQADIDALTTPALSDAQLDVLADKVAARLRGLRFEANGS